MTGKLSFLEDYKDKMLHTFPPLPNELVDKYTYHSCIKDTNDKVIYILLYKETTRRYILKSTLSDSLESVVKEHYILKKLKEATCPGIPDVFELCSFNGRDYLVEEYIPGTTLHDLIEAGRTFTIAEILSIAIQLCDILYHFHYMNPPIIHRDISPKNIILSSINKVSIIDMGIAREYDILKEEDTYVSGTPVLAPPEQFGYGQTEVRSDIYSFGILLYYLYNKDFVINPQALSALPKGLLTIIKKCTSFSPQMRYKNIKVLKAKLLKLSNSIKYSDKPAVFLSHYRHLRAICGILLLCLTISLFSIGFLHKTLSFYKAPVTFDYPIVEEAVRQELNLSPNAPITLNDLRYVHNIAICANRIYDNEEDYEYEIDGRLFNEIVQDTGIIEDLSDFSMMKNLKNLSLPNQKIVDITPLRDLPLTKLNLADNFIKDSSPLNELKELKKLVLGGNPIEEYIFLENLNALESLILDHGKLENLNFLNNVKLNYLSLNAIKLQNKDYSPILSQKDTLKELRFFMCNDNITSYINQLTKLINLRYSSSPIYSIEELKSLSQLEQLHLHSTQISSLENIAYFPNLYYLGIAKTNITDISPITNLKKLTSIDITDTPLTDYSLLKQLPLTNLWCSERQRELLHQE